jgi:prepilin-type processing-associated H-X9-DG protein
MVAAMVLLLAAFFLASMPRPRAGSRINCVNNQKQVLMAFGMWAADHNEMAPMHVSTNRGGSMEYVGVPNSAFRHFLVMSNELSTPKLLFCPEETNSSRICATAWFSSSSAPGAVPLRGDMNLSYFVGVDATDTSASMFLSGDRNITNNFGLANGLLTLAPGQTVGWSSEMHRGQGNIGFTDGSIRAISSADLPAVIAAAGNMTNRLAVP